MFNFCKSPCWNLKPIFHFSNSHLPSSKVHQKIWSQPVAFRSETKFWKMTFGSWNTYSGRWKFVEDGIWLFRRWKMTFRKIKLPKSHIPSSRKSSFRFQKLIFHLPKLIFQKPATHQKSSSIFQKSWASQPVGFKFTGVRVNRTQNIHILQEYVSTLLFEHFIDIQY